MSIKISPLARKLGTFVALSDPELALLERLHQRRRMFVAGKDLVQQGQSRQTAYILAKGWAVSYKILEDGGRQIVDFQIPGDFLGLRSTLLRLSDQCIEAVTDIEVSEVLLSELLGAVGENTKLPTAVLWAASRDEAMVVEHLVNIGRRDASKRLAHFLLELGVRLSLVGIGTTKGYECPLTQYLLADTLGLSAVHINRSLRQLRENGLVTFQGGQVVFDDHARLVEFANFDPAYLDQSGPLMEIAPVRQSRPINTRITRMISTVPSTPIPAWP